MTKNSKSKSVTMIGGKNVAPGAAPSEKTPKETTTKPERQKPPATEPPEKPTE